MRKLELTCRFGAHKSAPDLADLQRALAEVFCESVLGLPEADLAEHPSSWLTLGWDVQDGWTTLSVDIHRGGLAILTKLADQDDAHPEYEYRRNALDETGALQLWQLLATGAESELLAHFSRES